MTSTLLGGILLVVFAATPQGAAARTATLTVEREEVCRIPMRPDHMRSTDVVALELPEVEGPVSGAGSYRLSGSGYSLSGPSRYRGEVRADEELVLTFGQWSYAGKPMTSSAPEMPSPDWPVRMPLEPGAEKRVEFENAHADKAPCSGVVVYRLDLERETQRWRVSLTGSRLVEHLAEYRLIDPPGSKARWFKYGHGIVFRYDLAAEVELTKRRGTWRYGSATIVRAVLAPKYAQQPELYKVTKVVCPGCATIAALAGAAIGGSLSNQELVLKWPNPQPAVTVYSTFAAKCAPGRHHATCVSDKKAGTNFADSDDDFLSRAAEHRLPLKAGTHPPRSTSSEANPGAAVLTVTHGYTLTRLK